MNSRAQKHGSVLVVVLVTLLFASAALLLFIERASSDLLVEAREADADRLQLEAYSALETTLAVLEDFRIAGEGLHSPEEGWGDPLEWADYEPGPGREVTVTFVDESGKLSLPRADFATLVNLFKAQGLRDDQAEQLSDALLGWMQRDYTPKTATAPRRRDYENAALPFRPPERSLRSFAELRAIDLVREQFFDESGELNDLGRRFVEAVSLYDYEQPNINAAPADVLAALGRYDEFQQRQLADYRNGTGAHRLSQRFFRSPGEVATVLGAQGVAAGFGAQIVALRVIVTVREGLSAYQLEAVVAPPGGARLVVAPAIPEAVNDEGRQPEQTPAEPQQDTPAEQTDGETKPGGEGLQYPFTLLEIRENAAIASEPIDVPAHLRPPSS